MNPYADAARLKKAVKLANVLHRCNIDADDVATLSPLAWGIACQVAHVHRPSPDTVTLVASVMRERHADMVNAGPT